MQNRLNRFKQQLILIVLVAALSASGLAQTVAKSSGLTEAEARLSANVKSDSIKKYTNALSADNMEGRGTMQPGGDKAANYIAERFKEFGLKPLGDKDSYLQSIGFREKVLSAGSGFEIDGQTLKHGIDFAVGPFSWKEGSYSGDLVFAAFGMESKMLARDDFSDVKMKGKVVVVLDGRPPASPEKEWREERARKDYLKDIAERGASAIVIISSGQNGNWVSESIKYFGRRRISLSESPDKITVSIPVVFANDSIADRFFEKSGITRTDAIILAKKNGFKPIELKRKATITLKPKTTKGKASNVVGYIEGSDPKLKAEAVVFSAHYDAYGIERNEIYNGAADNALGTAEMLAVAEAFSKSDSKPRRSLIFIAVTGEEYGLLGSRFWVKHPTWDVAKVAANLNLDGIATETYGPLKIIIGYGAEHSTLGALMENVADAYGVSVMPDPIPEEGIFYRSDHFSFVERGIPALMLIGGPEGSKEEFLGRVFQWQNYHYHMPSDDVMKDWYWDGAQSVAQIMAVMGFRIAEGEKMPSWLVTSRFAELKRGNK